MSNYINLPLTGLEEPLSEMEQFVQDTAHRFAGSSPALKTRTSSIEY